jgi:hypothetical protein
MRITFTQAELIATLRANGSIPAGLTIADLSIGHNDLEFEVCDFELHLDLEFDSDDEPPAAICALLKLNPQPLDQ